ncbi:hypothetical protein Tco_0770992 [Tanacetum coccineum]|uniref:Uncharacterized protein n=1 Tax=Tanacetum coccineum TaxID=301880 RepID=A0ABQ4ZF29_9ASTR
MSKSTKPHNCFDNNDFYYLVNLITGEKYATSLTKHFAARYHIQGIEDMILDRWGKKIHRYQIEALNGIHHWEDARKDFFKAELGNMSSDKVYSDKRIRCSCCCEEEVGVWILNVNYGLRRSDKKEYEFSYAGLPRLSLNDIEDMY